MIARLMIAATNVDTFGRAVLGYRLRMCDSYTLGSNALSGAATAQESQADVRIDEDLPRVQAAARTSIAVLG